MSGTSNILAAAAIAILALAPRTAAFADSLRISPINLSLGKSGTGILNAVNQGAQPIAAQVEAFDWQQSDGEDHLTPSTSLQISPPIIRLAPGQKQVVRVRVTDKPAGTQEKAYRVVVSELPNPGALSKGSVRVLLQFKLPVFVGGAQTTPRSLSWTATPSGSGLVLRVTNRGDRHVKLAGLHLVATGGRDVTIEPQSFYYVLPGAMHEWTLSGASISPGATLRIMGVEESSGGKIDDAVVASR